MTSTTKINLNFFGGFGFDVRGSETIYQMLYFFLEVIIVFCKSPDLIMRSNMCVRVKGRHIKIYLEKCVLTNENYPTISYIGKIDFENFFA